MSRDARWPDVMPCYLSVQDRELRIIETNELFRRDFGDRLGERCYAVYKERESPCPECPVLLTLEDGETHSSEETVVTKDGEVAHVVVTSAPVHDDEGQIVAVMEMSTKITELKELRQEIGRREKRFEQLFEIVPCYISVQDRDYQIVRANRLFREDFGERRGERCYRAYKQRDSICPDCPVEKTFADGEIHSSEETVTTKDGRRAEMIVYSMPVRDDAGEISSVMEVSTNITEVKQLQRQLTMMGLAVAGMAHRAKNILMGLEGGIFVVNTGFESGDEEMVKEGWEMVERNVGNVSRVVKDLLFCSKERRPRFEEDVPVTDIVDEVCDLYRSRFEEEGVELAVKTVGSSRGRYDPTGIHNLLTNLLTNALDACRFDETNGGKDHRVAVSCEQDPSGATMIEVTDNGAGIPDDVAHRVFENWFSTKGSEGTGLGLLVAQKVVKEHGGAITFASEPGAGTSFRVVFPPRIGSEEEKPTP